MEQTALLIMMYSILTLVWVFIIYTTITEVIDTIKMYKGVPMSLLKGSKALFYKMLISLTFMVMMTTVGAFLLVVHHVPYLIKLITG